MLPTGVEPRDLLTTNEVLYQLSYGSIWLASGERVLRWNGGNGETRTPDLFIMSEAL